MKRLGIVLFFGCMVNALFAQSPQAIEADLLKSLKKIRYWDEQPNNLKDHAGDSLDKANTDFGNKLKCITEAHPATINYPFRLLKKEFVDVNSSTDGFFRIYSWDTGGGGTMRQFANVMQYKAGKKIHSLLEMNNEDLGIPYYSNIYTFKTNGNTYYLGIYGIIESSRYAGTGIRVFAIQNDTLNNDVKIIKTKTGLHSIIFYEYDFGSVAYIAFEKRPTITFDQATQIIRIPVVDVKGKVFKRFINYKFNGQYFEKIKS